jgi:hypothetical protein
VALAAAACRASAPPGDISRERAIEIARPHASFSVTRVEAERTESAGYRVWRVTLQGEAPESQPLLRPTAIVEVDRTTGAVVSVAKS